MACIKTKDGEHWLEAKVFLTYSTEYLCTACGETVYEFIDGDR